MVESDALGIGHPAGERRHRPVRRHLEDAPDVESSADENRPVRRGHHVGPVVLAARESREELERAVAAEAEQLTARREEHEIVGGERRQGDHVGKREAARATPAAGEQRRRIPEASRQRDRRVEGEPEDQRTPVVLVAELLEARGRPLLGLREERVGVVDDHEPAQPVERERPAAREAAEPHRVERQSLVGREPPDPRPVLLTEEEVARPRVEREAPERRRRGGDQRDPDPRQA